MQRIHRARHRHFVGRVDEVELQRIRDVKTELPALEEAANPSEVVRVLNGCAQASLTVVALAENEIVRENIRRYTDQYQHVKPTITGADLRAQGVEPGPKFGRILRRLRAAWLNGEVSDATDEAELLRKLLIVESE